MTRETLHTPGPWQAYQHIQHGSADAEWRVGVPGTKEDTMRPLAVVIDEDNAEGNALAMAAAPDLLAACEAAFAESVARSESGRKWTAADQRVHERLRDTIAKARGQA